MPFKNRYILFFVVCALMFCLVGCGSDKTTESTETVSTTTDAGIATTAVPVPELPEVVTTEAEQVMDSSGFYPTSDYVKTVGETINVRVEPSTDSNIYMSLGPDEVVKRSGYNSEWCRVVIDGENFYIYADYVVETEAPADFDDDIATSSDASEEPKRIVIDPGKQANANMVMEPVGPDSSETKMGASDGFTGVMQGTSESELNLEYALMLKAELESRGYEVVLTRESNSVDLTNKARAEFANQADADILIRLQMNYSSNSELSGVMAITMTKQSPYNSQLYTESNVLATRLLQHLMLQTGASNHGIYETDEMTLINWSNIPVVAINLGYLSNESDESNLILDSYKIKVVDGLADGIDSYFNN